MGNKEHLYFPVNLKNSLAGLGDLSYVAGRIGVSRQQLSRYLSGAQMPTYETLRSISEFVGVELNDLLSDPSLLNLPQRKSRSPQKVASEDVLDLTEFLSDQGAYNLDTYDLMGVYEVYCLSTLIGRDLYRGIAIIFKFGDFHLIRSPRTKGIGSLVLSASTKSMRHAILMRSPSQLFSAGIFNLDGQGHRFGLLDLSFPASSLKQDMIGVLLTRKLKGMTPLDSMRVLFRRLPEGSKIHKYIKNTGAINAEATPASVISILKNVHL
ncbi:helix-turn-helix domain-containing protein [Szabonella alba]|uniref:Helix-turn-helix transcriptional regulator n=1 Tax=Szabonella alba TaxID=2804194 RepID=A0A8K0VGT3_9RHOB|nr:helix-turn-helix transcriptional regulator [Szabonella alba]MBL4919394.1 helix-turn-helix transcriptional regulator [Szabonella alba]